MAAKPINQEVVKNVVADWRTGEYSYSELAHRHKISKAKVGQLCKGVEQDLSDIVDAGTQYRSGLANHDRRIVDAVNHAVDERTKHIQFFNNAAIQNVKEAMSAICEGQQDYKARAETINKGREVVLGKTPDTAIQINNNQSAPRIAFEVID
jgi:hypothetical protein